jgi:hypothetical protein
MDASEAVDDLDNWNTAVWESAKEMFWVLLFLRAEVWVRLPVYQPAAYVGS